MKFAVLDFETTGSTTADRIIQVGLFIINDHEITDRYTSLVNPGMSIPSSITALTGIDDKMVKGSQPLDSVIAEMVPLLQDAVLVGHNTGFDLAFLQRALDEHGYFPFDGRVLDTMDALRILYPGLSSLQLSMVSHAFGIEHERPHQADSDAEATAFIWLQCMERFQSLPLLTLQRLEMIFEDSTNDFGWFIQEMRQYKELNNPLDMDSDRYFRQFALNVNDWGEELEQEEKATGELPGDFGSFYEQLKQVLKQRFDAYEDREAQVTMLKEVESALEQGQHLMIEAGTGTGKSLGYLIPSLYYGLKQDKKILVSTHTINLQEQLRERDLPLLDELFPSRFKAAVLKGRSHYLCLRKFEQKLNTLDFENGRDDRVTAGQMVVWLGETKRGDDEELHFANKGRQFWQTVESDSDSCLNRTCPWFKKCFYHRARHDANTADVIITNHSMLFTDTKAENRLLPAYKHLVIDEAHHFEEVAGKHLGIDLHYHGLMNTLHWLYKDSRSGQLSTLRFRLQKFEDERSQGWCSKIDQAVEQLVLLKEEWEQLSELLYHLLASKSDGAQTEGSSLVFRLKKESLPTGWDKLSILEENMHLHFNEALKRLDQLITEIKEVQDEYDVQSSITDLTGTVKELYRHRDALHFFMTQPDANYVYWLEGGMYNKNRSLQLFCVPVDVSEMLKQYFFDVKDSVIMTSATLSVGKSFDYTCEQLGLKDGEPNSKLKTVQLPSPFNYRKQALVAIPRDFPTLRGANGEKEFLDRLVPSLAEVALETRGRMLVLFTSNRMLKAVHAGLKDMLSPFGVTVLGQGVDSSNRSKLTRLFQNSSASVLLGTSSFWEGVDIPGDALSCLAIVRLPFQPPNHPLVEAKTEKLKQKNLNPFMKLSVPQAVIRFKQGFGRLVRTASDKGIVIIYDTRVIDTNYGKYFLYSLPGPKIEHMNSNQLVPRIKQWMGGNEA
ncbi:MULTISPECIES: ATP-dependent DNA helicase DinG [unclassified Paenibacillus]|uniref:ATP-dependent DNA helicase DinG n=1 Tax=unclassified Paenibacillus TaxID=185978 RepID=UPI001AE45335|nr:MULTISPECIES: ATP-dependent DNA helicase DinG [unclassified Paenibacillus]MBP1155302.1 ATP-dependent DNA helicase DinG [Paenibacillus sp. PvP091]MBP1169314.1 ATP-dependent DNA helicase DinG [Paenibacillus sp. PvR098]MBP2440342.1 ATP-dependent DNA helicase DinG [Paenibacillus sp. PvP052]